MRVLERVHEGLVYGRRVRRLAGHLARLVPRGASVLDVGCGDGLLASGILQARPDVELKGIDLLVRERTHIPVEPFDGQTIPYADASFDAVMFVDVLHHTESPTVLLKEARRVARSAILIKDHTADGFGAVPTLRFMDRVGNARHGVALPYNYWPERRWREAFRELGLTVDQWQADLGLYPWPASWVFGRSLHFLASLSKSPAGSAL